MKTVYYVQDISPVKTKWKLKDNTYYIGTQDVYINIHTGEHFKYSTVWELLKAGNLRSIDDVFYKAE